MPAPAASASATQQNSQQRRATRPVKEQALNCPRCHSTNTKFCYYNNYSLTQPRYFCKACRRYWTEGGSLRNVPVGGGSRKNKKHSSSNNNNNNKFSNTILSSPLPPIPTTTTSTVPPSSASFPISVPGKPYHGQDLNLGFPDLIGGFNNTNMNIVGGGGLSAMELLRSTGMTQMVHMSMPEPGADFGLHDIGIGNGMGSMQEGGGRLLFPFGDQLKVKSVGNNESHDHDHEQQMKVQGGIDANINGNATLFWGGASLGGGSW